MIRYSAVDSIRLDLTLTLLNAQNVPSYSFKSSKRLISHVVLKGILRRFIIGFVVFVVIIFVLAIFLFIIIIITRGIGRIYCTKRKGERAKQGRSRAYIREEQANELEMSAPANGTPK